MPRPGPAEPGARLAVSVSTTATSGRTVAAPAFSEANTATGSVAGGWWVLAVDRAKVQSTVNGLRMTTDYASAPVDRLFDDTNGNGVVDTTDANAFRDRLRAALP